MPVETHVGYVPDDEVKCRYHGKGAPMELHGKCLICMECVRLYGSHSGKHYPKQCGYCKRAYVANTFHQQYCTRCTDRAYAANRRDKRR